MEIMLSKNRKTIEKNRNFAFKKTTIITSYEIEISLLRCDDFVVGSRIR